MSGIVKVGTTGCWHDFDVYQQTEIFFKKWNIEIIKISHSISCLLPRFDNVVEWCIEIMKVRNFVFEG